MSRFFYHKIIAALKIDNKLLSSGGGIKISRNNNLIQGEYKKNFFLLHGNNSPRGKHSWKFVAIIEDICYNYILILQQKTWESFQRDIKFVWEFFSERRKFVNIFSVPKNIFMTFYISETPMYFYI